MNYLTQARGRMMPIPAGTFEPRMGLPLVSASAGEMGETPVTMGQFKLGIQQFAAEPFGAIGVGPMGRVCDVLRGSTAEIVAAAVTAASVGNAFGIRYSTVRRLVPDMDEFVARFSGTEYRDAFLLDDHPVVMVNWREAAAFAYSVECELPTELQWHWAALGGQPALTTNYPIPLEAAVWNYSGQLHSTVSVLYDVERRRNGYGLIDPIGNVWEWQANLWTEDVAALFNQPYGFFGTEHFPTSGYYSVCGGAWSIEGRLRASLSVTARYCLYASDRDEMTGFRLWRPGTSSEKSSE